MIQISRRERDAILARYPAAWIMPTKHRFFLAGDANSYSFQYLAELRNPKRKRKKK